MPDRTAVDVLIAQCKQIGYAEWDIKVIIHEGEIVGFDQLDSPKIKYRAPKKKD